MARLEASKQCTKSNILKTGPANKIQSTLDFKKPAASTLLSQEQVNRLIMKFVVADMQCFSVVEQPSFIELVTGLQPGRTVMSRKTVMGKAIN